MSSLREIGFTKYEREVYRTLLRKGSATGKEISENCSVPPTAVYPNLKSLLKKELIQKIDGEQTVYRALPVKTALGRYIEKKQKTLEGLKEQSIREAEELSKNFLESKDGEEIIQISKGKEFSSAVYWDAIKRVNKTFYVLGWRFEKVGERYNFLKDFKKAMKKGVDARIIVTGDFEKQRELVNAYLKAGIKLRYSPIENISILIVDEKECKITLKKRDLPEKYNLHVMDEYLAQALNSYFLSVWDKGQEII